MANKKEEGQPNRLLIFEPNPEGNRLIPNEDLNIIVELFSTKSDLKKTFSQEKKPKSIKKVRREQRIVS